MFRIIHSAFQEGNEMLALVRALFASVKRAAKKRRKSRYPAKRTFLSSESLENRTLLSVTGNLTRLWTDQQDYPPGSTALISGEGFHIGETVELRVVHTDGTPNTGM